jgi:hypothetical protein
MRVLHELRMISARIQTEHHSCVAMRQLRVLSAEEPLRIISLNLELHNILPRYVQRIELSEPGIESPA